MKKNRIILPLAVAGLLLTSIVGGAGNGKNTGGIIIPAQAGTSNTAIVKNDSQPSTGGLKNTPTATKSYSSSVTASDSNAIYKEKVISENSFIANSKRYEIIKYKVALIPNDPNGSQWWTTQTGLTTAWDTMTGTNTSIAVIDTGFALNHEEFAGRWLDNIQESGTTTLEDPAKSTCAAKGIALNKSCNGIDDDSNGFIDDVRGWDFINDDASTQAGETNQSGSSVWHATAVAGIAAATGNNSTGIAGVSWGAKILPLQALDDNGEGDTLSVARAIEYAVDRGVDVINLSLGSDYEDAYIREVIQYALDNGVIVVAAAGNDGCNCMSYPANYPEVIAVGASNSNGLPASFSSFGSNLDVLAPGTGMRSSSWSAANPTSGYINSIAGTSFATPYISGLLANSKASQPLASWGQITNSMLQAADHRTMTAASPRSNNMGFGYVRADTLSTRLSSPYFRQIRYTFTLDNSDALSAVTANECESGQYPTAPFYEIKQGRDIYYSISELTVFNRRLSGAVATQKGYVCTGLPTDRFDTVRLIDPAREFSNKTEK